MPRIETTGILPNRSSLPEAGGEAALYVNPENVIDISDKMEKLLIDEELRKNLIKKGHEQIKKFSWEKTAKETLAVLEAVAQNK
jgi:glycosyltransferase involved in cell wall biosynthesis